MIFFKKKSINDKKNKYAGMSLSDCILEYLDYHCKSYGEKAATFLGESKSVLDYLDIKSRISEITPLHKFVYDFKAILRELDKMKL